jgi:undecaprenyl-diphosphatase
MRFRAAATATDRAQWRRWLLTLLIGWLCVAGVVVLLIGAMRFALLHGYLTTAWEENTLRWIITYAPIDFSHAVWLGAPGDPIIIIPVFVIGTVVAIWRGYPLRGLSIAAAYLLVSLLVLLGWTIWDRARPNLVVNGMAAPDLHSFPSGHLAQSTAVYGMIWYFWLRKIRHSGEYLLALVTLVFWLGVVALSRIVLGAHWVTDIGAGVLIGLVWLAVLVAALRRAEGSGSTTTART